ncbi:MAG: MATE family efflux transporter, partial [Oscillospiraceae bacterium]|nr:MATE family efflux transporter [Oscillospiraceae bacterium]
QVIKLSANFVLESLLMRVGFMATALMGASLGTEAFAVHNVGMNFLTLGFAFGDGMQASAVALIGRSLGEGNKKKARRYGNVCQGLGLVMSLSIALIMLFGGRFLFSLFFREESAIAMGMIVSWYLIATVVFQIAQVIFAGSLRAAGDIKFILFSSLISVSIVRTAVTIVAVKVLGLGIAGLWMGILADQLARFITLTPRFYQGKWMDMVL